MEALILGLDSQAEADLLEDHQVARSHAGEHHDHDQGRAGDDAGGLSQAECHRSAVCSGLVVALFDATEQEDVIVH